MNMKNRRISVSILLTVCLLLLSAGAMATTDELTGAVAEVDKYGNLSLDITSEALTDAGWAPGDVLTVTVGGVDLSAPLGTAYSDVDTGSVVVRTKLTEGEAIIVAVNMGSFAETYGVAAGDPITLTLAEPAGYLDEYNVRQLAQYRTYERADYESDAVYANFRPVTAGEIGEGILYRSSSPANNELNRAAYADALAGEAGIQTVINLSDSEEVLEGYFAEEGFACEYYKGLYDAGHVILLDMGVDFSTADFQAKLAEGLRFLTESPAPYLIHCNEGKDRAGFVSLVLEALMGATEEEITTDYMDSYVNYYHVEPSSEQYEKVAESNARGMLRDIAGLEKGADLAGADLAAAAKAYLQGIGLTAEEIGALEAALKGA